MKRASTCRKSPATDRNRSNRKTEALSKNLEDHRHHRLLIQHELRSERKRFNKRHSIISLSLGRFQDDRVQLILPLVPIDHAVTSRHRGSYNPECQTSICCVKLLRFSIRRKNLDDTQKNKKRAKVGLYKNIVLLYIRQIRT